jgi:uracil-DNA glycosylase
MSDRRRLGEEIVNHLRFYREIGGRWVPRRPGEELRAPAVQAASRRTGPQDPAPAAPGPAQPQAARSSPGPAPAAPKKTSPPAVQLFAEPERPKETLEAIRADLGDCRRCKLAPTRTHIVFGSGNPKAELMFVGEAPGADEDAQGLPFVGRAGQLLTRIIESIGMTRDDVYICNILKCRPPGNRNPETDEIAACEDFLFRQVATIKPKVICALGLFGVQTLLRSKEAIGRLRGNFFEYRGVKLMPTFHPAYLLRNPSEKRKVWEDVQKVRDYLRSLRRD